MIRKLLIANRGEIACRIVSTCNRMGIATVAVYSDADEGALHVRLADEARHIGPAPARESYLDIEAILAAAAETGADAIHPGYGFLAENSGFAEACAKAGLVFVGPPADAIRAMGSKAGARALMVRNGVPVLPGYEGAAQDDETLSRAAEAIGFPVLIKPSAGGGGRGMRVVREDGEMAASLAAARREAMASFGDDRLILERYVERPRHVEVQVFGDDGGEIVHLFERDCSIQRRHQKLVEEAPAPGLAEATRAALHAAAVAAARAVAYRGAGTVEFLLDEAGGVFFMEMNTRLQVEHGVTEMITGLDLVEWQLRIADGERLPLAQDDISLNGHAIEARLCAEDPARDFAPSSGMLIHFRLPADGDGIRVDTGFEEGGRVPPDYDSLVAKILAHGDTREAARSRLDAALGAVEVAPVVTNADFLRACIRHCAFATGDVDTHFVEDHWSDLLPAPEETPVEALALAALAALTDRAAPKAAPDEDEAFSPWRRHGGFRLNLPAEDGVVLVDHGRLVAVPAAPRGAGYVLRLRGGEIAAAPERRNGVALAATIDGKSVAANVLRLGDELTVFTGGRRHVLGVRGPDAMVALKAGHDHRLTAPLPGVIRAVLVAVGDEVEEGAPLMVLEAMKVEHTIRAPAAGIIESLPFALGDRVEEGAVLVEFEG